MVSITLTTLQKIKGILKKESKILTRSYIAQKYGVHYYAVNIAFNELLKKGYLTRIQSTTKGELFSFSNNPKTKQKGRISNGE